MEKRVIIAFLLSFAVLYAFRALYPPATPPPTDPPPAEQTAPVVPAVAEHGATSPTSPSTPKPEAAAVSPPSAPVEDLRAEKTEDFVLETALYTATFSNTGAALKSFKLKAYTDGEGRPLELINETAGAKAGWPLAIVTGDAELDSTLAQAAFVGRREGERLSFEYAGGGVHARKTIESHAENYELSIQTALTRDGKDLNHSVAWQGDFGDQSIAHDPAKRNAVYQTDAKFHRANLAGLKEQQDVVTVRSGVEDQYFLAMFLLQDSPVPARIKKQEYAGADGKPVPTLFLSVATPEGQATRVYVGPKQREWLTRADAGLAAVIDYGWFEFIAKPLVIGLLWIHSYIGNFGWAIIILTLAINLVLFPLRLKQQVSMQKMSKIQPQMRRLQDQYKKLKPTDPRRAQLQTEMMNLYKEHGVNPMGGCLPLLLQMPVLFGFYNALNYSIELRRAPWILWIKDLSAYDPYYILPILMALSMLLMTRLTPTTVDPAQAKMMMIMPLMMTILFIHQSAGLVLYWLMSNVAGIGQQVFINKYWSPQAEAKLQNKSKESKSPPDK